MMKKKLFAGILALSLLFTALSSRAMAMPSYSPDGTCEGSDCHAAGEMEPVGLAAPEPAETAEAPSGTAAPAQEEAEPYGEAAGQMAGIAADALCPQDGEGQPSQEEDGFMQALRQALTELFQAFLRLLALLAEAAG